MKKAIILAIGNELVEGLIVDTNSKYLSSKLKLLGYYVIRTETLPDVFEIVVERLKAAIEDADLIITSGGLGPTEDDLTREAVAAAIKRELSLDEDLANMLTQRALKYYKKAPDSVKKQAMVIQGANVIDNPVGTAPGQFIEFNEKQIILLPGPPIELIPIFESVLDKIKTDDELYTRKIKTLGIPEAILMDECKDIIYSNSKITVATMASYERGVEIRFTGSIGLKSEIDSVVNNLLSKIKDFVYALDDDEMKDVVYKLLLESKKTVSFAESCTGGLISSTLVDIPGISSVFNGAIVAYSNEVKVNVLGVEENIINTYGAVSEECVRQMAIGARKIFNTDFALAVSGIAGPSGGSEQKPVGTVCIALASDSEIISTTHYLRGDRRMIRLRTVLLSLDILRRWILKCRE